MKQSRGGFFNSIVTVLCVWMMLNLSMVGVVAQQNYSVAYVPDAQHAISFPPKPDLHPKAFYTVDPFESEFSFYFFATNHWNDPEWEDVTPAGTNYFIVGYIWWITNMVSYGFPTSDSGTVLNPLDGIAPQTTCSTNNQQSRFPLWWCMQGYVSYDTNGEPQRYFEVLYNWKGKPVMRQEGLWNDPAGRDLGPTCITNFSFDTRADKSGKKTYKTVFPIPDPTKLTSAITVTNMDYEPFTLATITNSVPQMTPGPQPCAGVIQVTSWIIVAATVVVTCWVLGRAGYKKWKATEKILEARQIRINRELADGEPTLPDSPNPHTCGSQ